VNAGAGVQVLLLEELCGNQTNTCFITPIAVENLDKIAAASIIMTSGTMGEPKGVLHTIGNHYYSALGSHVNIPFNKGDTWLVSLPFYHVSGFSLIMRAMLYGGTLMFSDKDIPVDNQLVDAAITHLSLVPTQIIRFLREPVICDALKSKKAILIGGASCPQWVIEQGIAHELPLYISYGSTEMASQITTTGKLLNTYPKGSSGTVLPLRNVCIGDNEEIIVRGETLAKGYITKTGYMEIRDKDGWYHTRDRGHLDNEGNLFVKGRIDEMFVSGGENIYPEEIERELLDISGIEQCVVIAVPNNEFGMRPVAFVKTNKNGPALNDINKVLENKIERFKLPDRILPWPDDVPEANKISRAWFRKKLRALSS
jgi:O-succinylbenzoic acid--CoA ligase